MKHVGFACLVLIASLEISAAQSTPKKDSNSSAVLSAPIITLQPTDKSIITTEPMGTVFGAFRCDLDGNIYFRSAPLNAEQTLSGPLLKIARDGRVTRFQLKDVQGFADAIELLGFAFTVDNTGKVYALVRTQFPDFHFEMYMVSFSKDGTYLTKSRFEKLLEPHIMEALPDGNFFISGYEVNTKPGVNPATEEKKMFVGIFDSDGELKRNLKTSKDDSLAEKGSLGRSNPNIMHGDALVGPDGNVYVLKGTIPPTIQVFSLSGERVKNIELRSPIKDAYGADLMMSPGRILLLFRGPRTTTPEGRPARELMYGVFSMEGEPLAYYQPKDVKGNLACYQPDELTFFTIAPGNRYALFHLPIPR